MAGPAAYRGRVAKLELYPGFEQQTVARIVRPAVDRIKRELADGARLRAPTVVVWLTMLDPVVRDSHAHAEGQAIPANLRFKLRKVVYEKKGRGRDGKAINPAGGWKFIPGYDLARYPRDQSLPIEQKINCRCFMAERPTALADSIHAGQTEVEGLRVRAQVDTRFPRAGESEFGTAEDRAARYMRGSLDEVAARYRR